MSSRQKLALWVIAGLFVLVVMQSGKEKAVLSSANERTSSPVPSASPAPSPTPLPTATPQPLVGYCVNIPILMYHHIQPQAEAEAKGQKNINVDTAYFEQQMAYLKNSGYTTLSASQLADALVNKEKFPSKSIVLTFDDGYSDFYTNAYPVIQKYGLVANVMITTGLVNNPGYLTWEELQTMVFNGLVFPYNHTWSHASLASKPADKISFEILTAKEQLVSRFGTSGSNIFAYPYGSNSQQVIDFLRANGFVAGFSTIPGHVQCDSFIMTLHRNRVGNSPLSSYGL